LPVARKKLSYLKIDTSEITTILNAFKTKNDKRVLGDKNLKN
jgi:hypothetical protein